MNEEEDDHADGAASADDEDDSQLLDDVAAQHQILAPQQIALVLAAEREQSLSQSEGDNSGHIAPPPRSAAASSSSGHAAAVRTPHVLNNTGQHVLSLGGQTPGSRRSLGAVQSALYDRFGGSSEQGRQSSARQEHLAGPLSPPPIATGTHTRRVQPRLPHAAPAAGSVGGDANEDDANAAGPPPAPAAGAAGGENQLTGLDTAEDDLDTVEDDLFDAVEDNSLQSLIHFLSTITTRENVISVVKRFDNAKAVRLFAGLSTVLKEIEECELIKTSQEEEDDDDGGDSDEVTGAVNYLYVAAFLIEGYLEGLVSRRRAVDKPLEIIKEAFEVAELLYVQLESLDSLETNDAWQAKQKIFSVCELWWTGNFQDRDQLIADLIMLLLRDSLNEDPDECDVKRLYSIRSAINLLDFNDESLDRFKSLLLETVSSSVFLRTDEGKKFIQHLFTVNRDYADKLHDALKAQLDNAEESERSACADIYVAIWKTAFGDSCEALHKALKAQLNAAGASARTACADVYYRTWKSATRFSSDEAVDGEEDEVTSRQSNAGALDSGDDSSAPEAAQPVGVGLVERNAQSQYFDIRYRNGVKNLGFELARKMVNGVEVFVAVQIDQSNNDTILLREHDVLEKVNGDKALNFVGSATVPENQASSLTSALVSSVGSMRLSFRRYPENAVFSDPQPAPAPDNESEIDFSNPLPIGRIMLLRNKDSDSDSDSDDDDYIAENAVFVRRCLRDGSVQVQYVFPETRYSRTVQQDELEDLNEQLAIPAYTDGSGNRIEGSAIPAFFRDHRAVRSAKRKADADTLYPPNRHSRRHADDAYLTNGRNEKFGLVLSELSTESQQKYDDFGIRSHAGDVLDPPSGDVSDGFLLDTEFVRQSGTPVEGATLPLRIAGGININGHNYIYRNRKNCKCCRGTAVRKEPCPGRAEVVNGQCVITVSHSNSCILSSLVEGEVVKTPEEREAAHLELLASDQRSIYTPSKNELQVWLPIHARKQFPNLDEQLQLIDAVVKKDFAQCQEIVEDIHNNNRKMVQPYYYGDFYGLIASIYNERITYIGHVGDNNYIRLTLSATTAEGKRKTLQLNSAHVTYDTFAGPRHVGQPGTIDHSKSGGRRQHNFVVDLTRMTAMDNSSGQDTCWRLRQVRNRGATILQNERANPPRSDVCAVCTLNFDIVRSVTCSKCKRSFCRTCHRPNISSAIQAEPREWSCSYCIVMERASATLQEREHAVQYTVAMDESDGGGVAIGAGEMANLMA